MNNTQDIEKILKINKSYDLFLSENKEDLKEEYRKLCSKWHPDKNIGLDTSDVFAHIKELYEDFNKKLDEKFLIFKNKLIIDNGESVLSVKYIKQNTLEIGNVFLSNKNISYYLKNENEDLFKIGLHNLSNLKFANKKMEEEIKKYLPIVNKKAKSDINFVIFEKPENAIILEDLLRYNKGYIAPKHVAWILSSMYNLACYFQYNNLMYGGFTTKDYLVDPILHSGYATYFWYSQKNEERIKALSKKAMSVIPQSVLNNKKANISLDLEMIRLVGRELLGDFTGLKLNKNKDIPKAMIDWLRGSTTGNAINDYKLWHEEVLKKSFGVRHFTKMEVKFNDIYK